MRRKRTGNYQKNLAAKLKGLRADMGVTQKDIADYLMCAPSYISAVESGNICISLSVLEAYCVKLDMTPDEVLGIKKPVRALNQNEEEMLEWYRTLTTQEKEVFMNILKRK